MNYQIIGGKLLLFNPTDKCFFVCNDDIFIKDGRVCKIGSLYDEHQGDYTTIDTSGKLIMPGLINMHTHSYMTFMRNYANDVPLNMWLFKKIMPVEAKMDKEEAFWTTLLGCMEMISTGTTTCLDMHIFHEHSVKAMTCSGIRAFMGRCLTGEDLYADGQQKFCEALEEKEKYESERIKFVLSPHSVYCCSEKMLRQIADEAAKRNMMKHIHVSESTKEVEDSIKSRSKTPVRFLYDIGFLNKKTIAAHCVKLLLEDIDLLSHQNVSVVTNPASNALLGNGVSPIIALQKAGVNVCLGTDSAASNNNLNMFKEMNFFSLLHKAMNNTSDVLSSNDVLQMATVNAAKSLGMERDLGCIAEGALADLIFMDLNTISMFPNNDILSSLCYSAYGNEISDVMINGEFVMRNNEFLYIDKEQVFFETNRIVKKYLLK